MDSSTTRWRTRRLSSAVVVACRLVVPAAHAAEPSATPTTPYRERARALSQTGASVTSLEHWKLCRRVVAGCG
jgi:hypothetical protein